MGSLWMSFGQPWSALGLPLAALRGRFGRPGTYGAWLKFIKNTYDYRREGLQFDVKTYDYRWEGENPSKIVDIDYREMCQIHESVVKKQLWGICIAVPRFPPFPPFPLKWCHEVQLGPPLSTRAGGQDDVSFTNSLKYA